jgi:hypothetical protein
VPQAALRSSSSKQRGTSPMIYNREPKTCSSRTYAIHHPQRVFRQCINVSKHPSVVWATTTNCYPKGKADAGTW